MNMLPFVLIAIPNCCAKIGNEIVKLSSSEKLLKNR